MKTKQIIILLLLLFTNLVGWQAAYCLPTLSVGPDGLQAATVRYVSKTGSSTPPYTSWATASDSIQKCINISSFGDTIYVANGTYKEQVVMIRGLSLIGGGMDSCIIDTRNLVNADDFVAVEIKDSSLLKGFHIIVYTNVEKGYAIATSVGNKKSLITLNKITNSFFGVLVLNLDTSNHSNINIYKNLINNISTGVYIFNSNGIVRGNFIYTALNHNLSEARGISIGAYFNTFHPVIDSNYIEVGLRGTGIYKGFGSRGTIANNTIVLKRADTGIMLGTSDSTKVFNNLIIAKDQGAARGIYNYSIQYLQVFNNYVTGKFPLPEQPVINAYPYNVVKNNVVTNARVAFSAPTPNPPHPAALFKYNNAWDNEINYNVAVDSTNLSVDPMIVNDNETLGQLDFHLQMFSPLIDAGDPGILDKDGSRSDIGLYGGLFGKSYKYLDLAPKPPRGLTVAKDSNFVFLKWKKNTEPDFKNYKLFRDTVLNFTADSTRFVVDLIDSFYTHIIPPSANKYYYKLRAVDNKGNQSNASEEVGIILVSVKDEWKVISDYKLYQNYPNPFNPSTTIGYRLRERGYVKLYVYDVKGELVSVLVNKMQETGYYEVEFSAGSQSNASGAKSLASGVYIYQLHIIGESNIPVYTDIKKMVYLK